MDDDKRLIARLLGPSGQEVTCDVCFEQLDAYVEAELAGRDADGELPGMREHLEGCPACAEDHESLVALVSREHR
jgi:anti-sigma factor RsiW